MAAWTGSILLPDEPLATLDGYIARGGGKALSLALAGSPDEVIDEVTASGLRGRGGAGFPTGVKWRTIRDDPCPTTYVVCNGADGEPGTFKDRWLLRFDPYQVLEGVAIAAHAVGATKAFIAIKAAFEQELAIVLRAIAEMQGSDMLGPVPVEVVRGPDEYLFGEEKALLEVIEGNDPLPRILPAYQVGRSPHRGPPTRRRRTTSRRSRTFRTSSGRARPGSARSGRRPRRGPCCSPCAGTCGDPASTSCRSVRRCGRSSSVSEGGRSRDDR